jgi:hypothetical protein
LAKYPNTKSSPTIRFPAPPCWIANEQCFGVRGIPSYRLAIWQTWCVSFGADFLGTWISPIEYARAYAKKRKIRRSKAAKMSRHYQVESTCRSPVPMRTTAF